MEIQIAATSNGQYQLDVLVMPRGEHHLEVIEPGDTVALVLIRGRLSATRCGRDVPSRQLVARPTEPVFLVTPGSYHVVAESHCIGLRGVRHGA